MPTAGSVYRNRTDSAETVKYLRTNKDTNATVLFEYLTPADKAGIQSSLPNVQFNAKYVLV